MKKVLLFVFMVIYLFFSYAFAIDGKNNEVMEALWKRKEQMINFINGWELETKIKDLKNEISKIKVSKNLDKKLLEKLNNDVFSLQKINNKLKNGVSNSLNEIQKILKDNSNKLLEKDKKIKEITENLKNKQNEAENLKKLINKEIEIKKEVIKQLNETIRQNEVKEEKINLLLQKYLKEKDKNTDKVKKYKIYVFSIFTLFILLFYYIVKLLHKKWRLDWKKMIYIDFLLWFFYIIFLVWFLFYLYPQLSIFLIFISWYLLVVNTHLVASFIWSIVVLQRYKMQDVIKFNWIRWQIIKITPLHVVLLPLTEEESIIINKPINIPHINLLKENVTVDKTPKLRIHKFRLTIRIDSWVDVMKFVEYVETNILSKFLQNKLVSFAGGEDNYRITFEHTNFWHITVVFIWRDEDEISKKVERKIIGHFQNLLNEVKKKELSDKSI